jgi:hypothetical protein
MIANKPSDAADDQLKDDFVGTEQFDTETANAPDTGDGILRAFAEIERQRRFCTPLPSFVEQVLS